MEKRDRFSLENDENFFFVWYTVLIAFNWTLLTLVYDAKQRQKKKKVESIFCHKTIINFRFGFFSFLLSLASSFFDGMKKHKHATNVCCITTCATHIKTAIPSNICCRGCRFKVQIKLFCISIGPSIWYLISYIWIVLCISVIRLPIHAQPCIQLTNNGKALTFEFNLIPFQIHSNCVCVRVFVYLYNSSPCICIYFNDVHSLFAPIPKYIHIQILI